MGACRWNELGAASRGISNNLYDFVFTMACANTVFPVTEDDGEVTFESQSPDELALVEGARDVGMRLHSRGPRSCQYQVHAGATAAERTAEPEV